MQRINSNRVNFWKLRRVYNLITIKVDFVEAICADATTVGHNRRFDTLREERHTEIRQLRELVRKSAVF